MDASSGDVVGDSSSSLFVLRGTAKTRREIFNNHGIDTLPEFLLTSERHSLNHETVLAFKFTVTTSSGVFMAAPSEAGWNSTRRFVASTITRR